MLDEARAATPPEEHQPLGEPRVADGLIINEAKAHAVFGTPWQRISELDHFSAAQDVRGIQDWNTPQPDRDTKFHHSLRGPWWMLEAFPHKYFDEAGDMQWRYKPWPHDREIPKRAIMHPEVVRRFKLNEAPHCPAEKTYNPRNLKFDGLALLDDKAIGRLHPDVRDSLVRGIMRCMPEQPKPKAAQKELPKAVAAACVLVGAAAWIFSRRT